LILQVFFQVKAEFSYDNFETFNTILTISLKFLQI